jgi:hypothetical protein
MPGTKKDNSKRIRWQTRRRPLTLQSGIDGSLTNDVTEIDFCHCFRNDATFFGPQMSAKSANRIRDVKREVNLFGAPEWGASTTTPYRLPSTGELWLTRQISHRRRRSVCRSYLTDKRVESRPSSGSTNCTRHSPGPCAAVVFSSLHDV